LLTSELVNHLSTSNLLVTSCQQTVCGHVELLTLQTSVPTWSCNKSTSTRQSYIRKNSERRRGWIFAFNLL